jgi:predicted ATPase
VLVDDMCEEIHQHIVSLYALLGNRNKAVEQFRSCKQVLDRELNLQPSPETEKIYQDALEGRIHSHFKGVQPHAPRREDVEKGKFVGREDSWENLIRWAEGIQWGVGGVVLVHGEQGVGKTRLVKEAMSSLGEDTLILWANCYPGSQSVPLQPIIQLFHNINKHSSRFPRFPDEKLEGIFRFPLKDFQEQPKADGSHYEMVRFSKVHYYFLVIEFFLELAETCSPVIICLEDINFADAETIEFLNYFATLIRREKILVILTYCCVVSAQLKQYLNHQHLMSSFRGAIQLSGLDDKDIASLVSRFSEDRPVSQDLINHLRKVTGGNPLFLIELLELVHRSGMPFDSLSKPGGFPLPPTVEKVIKLRLDQLERPQRDLLSMAAFIGIRFSYERLRQSSDLPTERLLDHLDDLVSRHFLVDEGEHYRFRHGLLHSVVINSLSAARIRELKRCVKME